MCFGDDEPENSYDRLSKNLRQELDEERMKKDLYDKLGVEKTASKEELKKAYRDKSKEMHPDHGGDPEQFKELAVAYKILSDSEKRKRYDKGESTDSLGRSKNDEVMQMAINLMAAVVDQMPDVEHQSILQVMLSVLKDQERECDLKMAQETNKIRKKENALKRLTSKKNNVLGAVMQNMIGHHTEAVMTIQSQKEKIIGCRELLNDYEYRIDAQAVHTGGITL
jgi:hypothetical protein